MDHCHSIWNGHQYVFTSFTYPSTGLKISSSTSNSTACPLNIRKTSLRPLPLHNCKNNVFTCGRISRGQNKVHYPFLLASQPLHPIFSPHILIAIYFWSFRRSASSKVNPNIKYSTMNIPSNWLRLLNRTIIIPPSGISLLDVLCPPLPMYMYDIWCMRSLR